MFLDHPNITATNSLTEPDRIERLSRVYGFAVAMGVADNNPLFIEKVTQLHDHKGTLIVFWHTAPTEQEKAYWLAAWSNRVIGDGSDHVEHEI